jgi:hypothetical protein
MVDEKRLQEVIDRSDIINVISKSIITRDSGLWEELATCYHSQAEFTSSWWKGKASDFINAARPRLEEARKEGGEQKHMTGSHWIVIDGDRATAECDLVLFSRRPMNGVELDFQTFSRRLHLMAKENGEWKIWRRFAIYEKARLDTTDPTIDPEDYYDAKALAKYPRNMQIHLWRLDVKGSGATKDICIKGTEQDRVVRGEARKWMEPSERLPLSA